MKGRAVTPKDQVVASIARARADLEEALAGLEKLPAFDPSAAAYAAHALNNYLMVADGNIQLLAHALAGYPDPQVHACLEGPGHATHLMTQTVAHLMNASAALDLLLGEVDLARLVRRACEYYQRVADRKQIAI